MIVSARSVRRKSSHFVDFWWISAKVIGDNAEQIGRLMRKKTTGREVLVELQQIGNAVKVTAIDPETLVEVSIMGPTSVGEQILKHNVIKKLNYVISKK
jgi:hypothetical protein